MSIKIYLVGGTLRDQLLGLSIGKDLDYAVEAPSYEAMRDYILANGGTIWQEREQYLTIRAKMPKLGDADFVLCRRDGFYSDGRRPDNVTVGTIYDDLARRDFTMNAIAQDVETGEYIDPHNGRTAITVGLIRCVGNSFDRFNEDPLRMLRAIRFSITKDFQIVNETEVCLYNDKLINKLNTVSVDRVRDELTKCFKANSYKTLLALNKFGRLTYTLFKLYPQLWLKPTTEE